MLRLVPLALSVLLALPSPAQEPPPDFLVRTQQVIGRISEQIKPAVVHIEVYTRQAGNRAKALGTGVVVSADGWIVTNHHVVDRAEQVVVILDDRTRHTATIVRDDSQTDLAVVRIEAGRPLATATFADSDAAQVGQWVLAVGNPYGLDRTVSFGIISGKGRFLPGSSRGVALNDFLQTDALIDPGSSGGPLVDLQGRVLGINSSGIGRGIGFTIPSKIVQEVLSGKTSSAGLERGWLGLYVQPLTRELAHHLGLDTIQGLLVSDTAAGSPARHAGLQPGDVLLAADGELLNGEGQEEIGQFAQRVARWAPGRNLALKVRRGAQVLDVPVQVAQQPSTEAPDRQTGFGFSVAEVTRARQQTYRLDSAEGVVVTEVLDGSAAEESGVEAGDRLLEVEGRPVHAMSDLPTSLLAGKAPLLLQLRRGQQRYFALLTRAYK